MQLTEDLHTIHVEEHQSRVVTLDEGQRFFPVFGQYRFVAEGGEDIPGEQAGNFGIVRDDQYLFPAHKPLSPGKGYR